MRKVFSVCTFLVACSCQQSVVVPTAKELIDSPQLLAKWQAKCDTGEYSRLPADVRANMCATTRDATISVAQSKAGNEEADFFKNNTIRKN
jgi:hypothetical protein